VQSTAAPCTILVGRIEIIKRQHNPRRRSSFATADHSCGKPESPAAHRIAPFAADRQPFIRDVPSESVYLWFADSPMSLGRAPLVGSAMSSHTGREELREGFGKDPESVGQASA
jgi:hypothetical protein